MGKVILVLIDSLMSQTIEKGLKSGKTPALKYLMENGIYNSECVTAFPTMTATVDATLFTGAYPEKHNIPGLVWYDSKKRRLIDYINGPKTVLSLGINKTLKDALINLNERHLSKSVSTIYEDLYLCKKTAASINFIIHRGKKKHKLKPPLLINIITKFSLNKATISGPESLFLGVMCKSRIKHSKISWGINQIIFKRYGTNDKFAIKVAKKIIKSGEQPDFMAIYLPDHDHYLHKKIDKPLPSLIKVDKQLEELLNSFGTWKDAINNNTFIIIGDHGQTKVIKKKSYEIDLDLLFNEYNILRVGKEAKEYNEVVIANNERMAYIYSLKKELDEKLINILLSEERIDFISRRSKGKILIENSNGEKLIFTKTGKYIDPYGYDWCIEGDFNLLDIEVDEFNNLKYNSYPDALSRLYGAMYSHDGTFFAISAKTSYEFKSKTFPKHLGGGSHGSLHKIDSLVPLLVVGNSQNSILKTRITDLKNYIIELLKQ